MNRADAGMPWFKIIDRIALLLGLMGSGFFLLLGEYAVAAVALVLWLILRPIVTVADVFYTAFTGHPLIKAAPEEQAETPVRSYRNSYIDSVNRHAGGNITPGE